MALPAGCCPHHSLESRQAGQLPAGLQLHGDLAALTVRVQQLLLHAWHLRAMYCLIDGVGPQLLPVRVSQALCSCCRCCWRLATAAAVAASVQVCGPDRPAVAPAAAVLVKAASHDAALPPEAPLCFVATTTAGTWCAGLRQLAAWRRHAAHEQSKPRPDARRRSALALTSPGVNSKLLFKLAPFFFKSPSFF